MANVKILGSGLDRSSCFHLSSLSISILRVKDAMHGLTTSDRPLLGGGKGIGSLGPPGHSHDLAYEIRNGTKRTHLIITYRERM